MVGAIEFLRKAKAICLSRSRCKGCPLEDFCLIDPATADNEADQVRMVMEYQIKKGESKDEQ